MRARNIPMAAFAASRGQAESLAEAAERIAEEVFGGIDQIAGPAGSMDKGLYVNELPGSAAPADEEQDS